MFLNYEIDSILLKEANIYPNANALLQKLKYTLEGLNHAKVLNLYPTMMNFDVPEAHLSQLSNIDLVFYRE